MNALIAGVSRKATIESPATSTALAPGPCLMVGKTAALKPVFAFAFVEERMTPATKSASNTIAAFGGDEKALVTESLKLYCSAPDVPPAMFDVSPRIWPIVVNAVFTDGSVHGILCALRALYLSGPKVRR